ncbi:MAG: membrane dipeptidase [Sphingobacteriaceae bacterium]|nr:membrane dipeptidase [Cytophagaceae bacterium]
MKSLPFLTALAVAYGVSALAQRPAPDEKTIQKAKKIHAKIFTVDTHCDTPMQLMGKGFDLAKDNTPKERAGFGSKVDFPRMQKGGMDAMFFAVYLGQGPRTPEGHEKARKTATTIFDSVYAAVGRLPQMAKLVTTPEEAYALEKEGKRAIFLGMENGYMVGHDLALLKTYYDRGVRYLTLCHSSNNDICDSSTDPKGAEFGGLSPFGEKVVADMNRLGMMVDLSHTSDSSVLDVLRLSKAPVIASHSGAKALCDHPRNLSDDLARGIAKTGGVVQLVLLSDYIKKAAPNPERDAARVELMKKYGGATALTDEQRTQFRAEMRAMNQKFPTKLATLDDALDHLDHLVKVMGIDHVGIGGDLDGGGGLDGAFDVSEMENITVGLVQRGYSEKDIRKIWSGNLFRVMAEVQKVAAKVQREGSGVGE